MVSNRASSGLTWLAAVRPGREPGSDFAAVRPGREPGSDFAAVWPGRAPGSDFAAVRPGREPRSDFDNFFKSPCSDSDGDLVVGARVGSKFF